MEKLKPFCKQGKRYVYFGTYPQSKKAESVTVGTEADEKGYYTGSDGEKYAIADGEYFKVEPIKWRILQEEGGTAFLWSEMILANRRFDSGKNNYAQSEIRSWLNGVFYERAFSATEKERIVATDVDNSAASTGKQYNPYACVCEDTKDNVFLLSFREATGFGLTDADRQKFITPYVKKTGAFTDEHYFVDDRYYGKWWLRSPDADLGYLALMVYYNGHVDYTHVDTKGYCVVPALRIKLS